MCEAGFRFCRSSRSSRAKKLRRSGVVLIWPPVLSFLKAPSRGEERQSTQFVSASKSEPIRVESEQGKDAGLWNVADIADGKPCIAIRLHFTTIGRLHYVMWVVTKRAELVRNGCLAGTGQN